MKTLSSSDLPLATTSPAHEAWALMLELFAPYRSRLPAIAAEFDLSPMQAHVLRVLDPHEPLPMSALACALSCDASNVTGIVDRLEQRGLVERRGASHDRRVKMLAITTRGFTVRHSLVERLLAPPPELERLSKAQQCALRDVLRRALGSV